MKNIVPYSDSWINCYANMVLSLICYKNGSDNVSYCNNYNYILQRDTQLGYDDFYFFDYDDDFVKLEEIANTEFITFDGTGEELVQKIKEFVAGEDAFVAVDVDLYDWIPNSMCYKKYHWNHFSLITDYCEDKDKFICFDEMHADYNSFYVSAEQVANSLIRRGDVNLIEINQIKEGFSRKVTLGEVLTNARRIVDDIESVRDKIFFKLDDEGYRERHYMDLIAMYYQRMESRHYRNSSLLKIIDNLYVDVLLDKEAEEFADLAKHWEKIRHRLIKLYVSESNRERKLELINKQIKEAFDIEQGLWNDLIQKTKMKDPDFCIIV